VSRRRPSLAEVLDPAMPEFEQPPSTPMELLHQWSQDAVSHGIAEFDALAFATVDHNGQPSNRMIRILYITGCGLVFTSHSGSRKGRDIAETGRAAGVYYWPELGRQIVVTGIVRLLPDEQSEHLWSVRSPGTHPMSVATQQSAVLEDQHELLTRARELADADQPLQRPPTWVGYEFVAESVEFWHVGAERLHRRLRYDLAGSWWSTTLLQP